MVGVICLRKVAEEKDTLKKGEKAQEGDIVLSIRGVFEGEKTEKYETVKVENIREFLNCLEKPCTPDSIYMYYGIVEPDEGFSKDHHANIKPYMKVSVLSGTYCLVCQQDDVELEDGFVLNPKTFIHEFCTKSFTNQVRNLIEKNKDEIVENTL